VEDSTGEILRQGVDRFRTDIQGWATEILKGIDAVVDG
jgi:hypothetical protein